MYIYICFGGVGSHLQLLDPDLRKKLLLPETENNTESETAKPNWKCSLYGRKKNSGICFCICCTIFLGDHAPSARPPHSRWFSLFLSAVFSCFSVRFFLYLWVWFWPQTK